jgi:histidinol dehydrogenase
VAETVAAILAAVRLEGDPALVDATARLDWPGASIESLRVPGADLEAAFTSVDADLRAAFTVARDHVAWFHRHEVRRDWEEIGPVGQRLGIRYLPVHRAGLYVPGGLGSYASTVIMNAVPARVAGVEELFICTPPGREGSVNESVLAAAWFMGITEVYGVGGAQAVAAMAYGTASVRRADVICGPGNAYVMEAKRQVYGAVGIDGLAGPSEVIVVADTSARPEWVAADLLAQEEHGSGATAVLVAASEGLCRAVAEAVEALRRGGREGLDGLHAFFPALGEEFGDLAAAFVNEYAPEHLELHLVDARTFLAEVRSAGAVFVGGGTPTSFGDYVAGSNHVLPTGGAARFSSPLSVDTFMRASSVVEIDEAAAAALTAPLARLARSEGFTFHRRSVEMRSSR